MEIKNVNPGELLGKRVSPYEHFNPAEFREQGKKMEQLHGLEWRGLYMASKDSRSEFTKEVIPLYASDQIFRKNQEAGVTGAKSVFFGTAYLHEVVAKEPLKIVVLPDDIFIGLDKAEIQKAAANHLGLDENQPISIQLGQNGMAVDMPHDENGGREVLIPMELLEKVDLMPKIVYENTRGGEKFTEYAGTAQDLDAFNSLTIEPTPGSENQQNQESTSNDVAQNRGVRL